MNANMDEVTCRGKTYKVSEQHQNEMKECFKVIGISSVKELGAQNAGCFSKCAIMQKGLVRGEYLSILRPCAAKLWLIFFRLTQKENPTKRKSWAWCESNENLVSFENRCQQLTLRLYSLVTSTLRRTIWRTISRQGLRSAWMEMGAKLTSTKRSLANLSWLWPSAATKSW